MNGNLCFVRVGNHATRTTSWWCLAIAFLVSLDAGCDALVSSVNVRHCQPPVVLAGDWAAAKAALRNPDCCVVSVLGLGHHLKVLQDQWANAPADVDLRARVRVVGSSADQTYNDCLQVRRAVSPFVGDNDDDNNNNQDEIDPCTAALQELACGVAALADGPFEETCNDVFLRIVCASSYKARDPMYHTDKAPLRGYVTLRGPGTDFMTRTSTPMEYMTLRGLGSLRLLPSSSSGESDESTTSSLRRAEPLEFIVMKGDHYVYELPSSTTTTTTKVAATKGASWMSNIWNIPDRTAACVHRSPPADATTGGRRLIVSLDLADGDDDREWYEVNKKREWRSGMTQRKSPLVA